MEPVEKYFDKLWSNYIQMTPQALKIKNLFEKEGESIVNDHIALRTFDHAKVNISVLAKYFQNYGYTEGGDYHFEEKKLYAKHFEHSNPLYPKVFISELLVSKFSNSFQDHCTKVIDSIDSKIIESEDFLVSGRTWDFSAATYQDMALESEYGSWLCAIGFRPNHFTISVNHLKKYRDLEKLNSFLKENGFKLNDSGGEIKGSKEVLLEQSSTIADKMVMQFQDKELEVPTCYFEFAKRYSDADGNLYQGFVAKSADKIFESTNN